MCGLKSEHQAVFSFYFFIWVVSLEFKNANGEISKIKSAFSYLNVKMYASQ